MKTTGIPSAGGILLVSVLLSPESPFILVHPRLIFRVGGAEPKPNR